MKIKSYIVRSVAVGVVLFGLYLYVFPSETEYITEPIHAYIEGATAPQFEPWEM